MRASLAGTHARYLAIVIAVAAVAGPAAAALVDPRSSVPRGDFLVSDAAGRLRVLDEKGKVVRRLPRRLPRNGLQAIALAADRRHAYVAVDPGERAGRLYLVDLATGRRRKVANGISPTVSPDDRRLAYVRTVRRNDIDYKVSLVVRDLRTHVVRSVSLGSDVPVGTPPDNVINWSPDGRRIAIYVNDSIRLVDLGADPLVLSQPVAPRYWNAPAFVDRHTLIALANCCIGRQRLVAIDLRSGMRRRFVTLSAPPEAIGRLRRGALFVVTALRELVIASRQHATVIADGISVADH